MTGLIPDLGRYSIPILGAYAVTLTLIVVLVLASLCRSMRVKRALDIVESSARGRAK